MSFAPTIRTVPGVFYRDIGRSSLGLALGDGKGSPTPVDLVNYPWGKYSAQTLQFQNIANAILIKRGYCPMIADGKLGPATCGAGTQIFMDDPGGSDVKQLPTMQGAAPFWMPTTCDDSLFPKKVSGPGGCSTGPMPPVLTPAEQAAQQTALSPQPGSSSGKTIGIAAAAVAAIGLIYFMKRR